MRLTSRLRAAVPAAAAVAVIALSASGCSPQPEPKTEILSATKAGGVYLDAVCPVNTAWDEADVELDRLRLAVGRGEDGEVRAFADAMRAVAEASEQAGERLASKDRAWPRSAEDEIEAVAETLRDDRKQALAVAKLSAEDAAAHAWKGGAEAGQAAAEARAALGLPADPEAACEQWTEREGARD